MTNSKMDKYTAGFGLSVAVTSLLNAILLLVKETNPALMNAMKAAMGHHWTTHGTMVLVLFVLLGFVFSATKFAEKWDSGKMVWLIVFASIIGSVAIAGFFLPNLPFAGGGMK
ncbi:MAG: hypothetical protein A4E73_03621 [Syntrophaceae bacterium PtaU1.Bin231]|nr:MAG: hypothetical protein A4E73_03621 [Syntrophaceae bacterium PtaU1.Bin231]HOG17651.1 hypothetical protein [Syntrophales bacterium]